MFPLGAGADQVLILCPHMLLEVLKSVVRSLREPVQPRWMYVALRNVAVGQEGR